MGIVKVVSGILFKDDRVLICRRKRKVNGKDREDRTIKENKVLKIEAEEENF